MVSKACVTASYRGKLREMVRQADLELVLVVPPAWGALPYEPAANEPFRTRVVRTALSGQNHLHWYPGLGRILADERPDLVHVDEEHYSLVTAIAFREAARLGVPALFFTWQNIFKRYPWPFSWVERFVFRHAVGAIAGNTEASDVLRHKGYQGLLAVIPQFGTDPDVFRPRDWSELRAAWGYGHDVTVVAFVGRLVPEKGIDTLVEATLPLLRTREDVRLVLVGSGPMSRALQGQLATSGTPDRTRMVSWVPSERMPDLMNAIDILVLPSRTTPSWKEQFGRVLPEAMASGALVVGSNSGEIPNVIGDAGRVFEEGNAHHLRQTLEDLLDRPDEAKRLQQAGRTRAREQYSQRAVAQRTLAFYKAVAARPEMTSGDP